MEKIPLLGVKMRSDLKWSDNTDHLVKKFNNRMQLLKKVASFSPPMDDLRHVYITFLRTFLEQNCVLWHSSLTKEKF